MKGVLGLLAAFFAATNALVIERQTPAEHVKDGSFEDIAQSRQFDENFKDGGWTFKNIATLRYCYPGNSGSEDCTLKRYGNQWVEFADSSPGDVSGSVSQKISGLTGGTFKISYIYREIRGSTTSPCALTATLGSQVIDSVAFPTATDSSENFQWLSRSQTFTPSASSGTLKMELRCATKSARGDKWFFQLDGVSITGPS